MSNAVRLSIDGLSVQAEPGQTVLEVARAHDIDVPTLCHHPDLLPVGICRLCIVELEGQTAPIAACVTQAREGMVIRTHTASLRRQRRRVLELLLLSYHDKGYTHTDREPTELEQLCRAHGLPPPRSEPSQQPPQSQDSSPVLWVDWDKCILCDRCIRACAEQQGRFVWSRAGRGVDTRIIAGRSTSLRDAGCESCGACAAYCPSGALDDRMALARPKADRTVSTTCGYCGVGCRFDLEVVDERISRVASNPDAPVNSMRLCVKGRYGYDFVHHPDRLSKPQVRSYLLEGRPRPAQRGDWVEVDWPTALELCAQRLASIIRESGPAATGVLASAKCSNEEGYLMQKLARQLLGSHNVDHCARLCHSSTVAGLVMAYGSGAMSNTMRDVADEAAAFFVIGSNTTEQHPVFGTMLRRAVIERGAKLVVADPRAIDLTQHATLHLRQRPGTDVALINALMHVILREGLHDEAFIAARCEGFDELVEVLDRYPPDKVAELSGVAASDIEQAARLLARHSPMAVIWSMGITQHTTGVLNVLSLANLQMLLGNIGVAGGGVNPLRGQNNVQGACDVGALVNVFPGYQSVASTVAQRRFAEAWALDDGGPRWTAEPGATVTEMIDRAGSGQLRGLYILGEDPAMTDPDLGHVHKCLDACELLILQEIFPSETARFADVLLPGCSFAEKDGTFTNTERRIQLIAPALAPLGDARPDWVITSELARRLMRALGREPVGPLAAWSYSSTAEIMDEIATLTPIYRGVSHARLQRGEQLHWPVLDAQHPGTPILHVDSFSRGRGKFHVAEHIAPAEIPDADYPLILTTGRVLYHWHGGELTRRAKGLSEIYPEALVEVSLQDAARCGLADGDRLRVISRRGQVVARTLLSDRVAPGLVFASFHFPGEQNANNLTNSALDPVAKIPEYKVCAVRIERAEVGTD